MNTVRIKSHDARGAEGFGAVAIGEITYTAKEVRQAIHIANMVCESNVFLDEIDRRLVAMGCRKLSVVQRMTLAVAFLVLPEKV